MHCVYMQFIVHFFEKLYIHDSSPSDTKHLSKCLLYATHCQYEQSLSEVQEISLLVNTCLTYLMKFLWSKDAKGDRNIKELHSNLRLTTECMSAVLIN